MKIKKVSLMLEENIKMYRKNAHLTQSELGEKIGVGKSTVSMYESGERIPPIDVIQKLCHVFNTDMDTLVGRAKKTTPEEPKLSEGEEELLKLIRLMPSDMKALYLETLRATLKGLGLI